ncbi:2-C-methyl-D-erythritol 4-phosphate cytidylyltransferase [Aliidiomarina celeris]|uniref:2-C-methyl-D-erythritol 4-phosphate cytidylyltransferase n=1 Tax=Aliidiomarina celeris TaxID=2249428 RepID=UPI001E2DD928|nr:2-C-methyl-D-erythritol 4-phosphate cytidylyltransferase [Aliidiomarina celeris]
MTVIAIVPAAGIGQRMQSDRPKQYLQLGERTILEHSVEALLNGNLVECVYVAVQAQDPYFASLPIAQHPRVRRVQGGTTRAESVLSALSQARNEWPANTMVAVHDAARPGLSLTVLKALLVRAAEQPEQGAIVAMPAWDTMKMAHAGSVEQTIDRRALWHAFTPQVFQVERLYSALTGALKAGIEITDESSAMEWAGHRPALVEGEAKLRKITSQDDLIMVSALLANEIGKN